MGGVNPIQNSVITVHMMRSYVLLLTLCVGVWNVVAVLYV